MDLRVIGARAKEAASYLNSLGITEKNEGLRQAAQSCRLAAESARQGFTAHAFLADAEQGAHLLDEVLGESVSEDIVHGIFARFCVGK